MLYTDQQIYSIRKKNTGLHRMAVVLNLNEKNPCCVHNWSVNLFFSTCSLVCMLAGVRGGKVEGGHIGGEQVFFDLLELKASWVSSGEGKKGERRGRAVTLSH